MRITLTITHTESSDPPGTHVFEQPLVRIGRAGENDLPLPDPTNVVSKQHAELRREDRGYVIEDVGSKNFTFVNGDRLAAARPRLLHAGDRVEIGPYRMEVAFEEEPPAASAPPVDLDRTVFAAGFSNPFGDEAEALAEVFGRLRRAVAATAYPRADEALADALRSAFGPGEDADALLAVLRGEAPGTPASAPTAERLPSPTAAPRRDQPLPDEVAHRLLEAVTRLLSIPWQFRHEFVGHTILHAPEAAFLYDGDAAALWRYLTETDDREERLRLLEDAADQVAVHQLGMLDGYRAAAERGASALLDAVDPDALEEDEPERGVGRLLASVTKGALIERVRERVAELRAESISVLERRFFRPAFIDAYLARIADRRAASPDS